MSHYKYQIGMLGRFSPYATKLRATLESRFADLGIDPSNYTFLIGEPEVGARDKKAPFFAVFFGYSAVSQPDRQQIESLITDSAPILPIVDKLSNFTNLVPDALKHINGMEMDLADPGLEAIAAVVLENFNLLRHERRLFISYRRLDSQFIAAQLYAELDRRGFDVFLDTNGVPPAKDFQSVLWHRLADSDIVILLDSPNFFESRWTTEEIARANSTSIQILHLLWPARTAPDTSAFSSFVQLDNDDFTADQIGVNAKLAIDTVERIAVLAESLRARALAARHQFLVDSFCDEARENGLDIDVQPSRHMTLIGPHGPVAVVPLVGVPTALRIHEIQKVTKGSEAIWILYDNRGLLSEAIEHLDWLNDSLPLQSLSVYRVAERLQDLAQS